MEPVQHLTRSHRWTAVASALLLAACAGVAAGCFTDKRPTEVMVTPVSTDIRPAKPPDCDMPVLTEEPTVALPAGRYRRSLGRRQRGPCQSAA